MSSQNKDLTQVTVLNVFASRLQILMQSGYIQYKLREFFCCIISGLLWWGERLYQISINF